MNTLPTIVLRFALIHLRTYEVRVAFHKTRTILVKQALLEKKIFIHSYQRELQNKISNNPLSGRIW